MRHLSWERGLHWCEAIVMYVYLCVQVCEEQNPELLRVLDSLPKLEPATRSEFNSCSHDRHHADSAVLSPWSA